MCSGTLGVAQHVLPPAREQWLSTQAAAEHPNGFFSALLPAGAGCSGRCHTHL